MSWLIDCGIVYQINRVNNCKIPLSAYQDFNAFKLYLLDVGLLAAMAGIDDKTLLEGNDIFEEFKGSLTEQYVLCQLKECTDLNVFYWSADAGIAEVDFIAQMDGQNVPIEVKANKSTNNTSLTKYNEKFNNELSIRFSMKNLARDGKIINIPLFMIEYMEKFI